MSQEFLDILARAKAARDRFRELLRENRRLYNTRTTLRVEEPTLVWEAYDSAAS
jgi:hypothetical protein